MNREQRLDNVWPEWEPIPWDVAETEAEAQRAGYDLRAAWPNPFPEGEGLDAVEAQKLPGISLEGSVG